MKRKSLKELKERMLKAEKRWETNRNQYNEKQWSIAAKAYNKALKKAGFSGLY